jgi:hypothetical protein
MGKSELRTDSRHRAAAKKEAFGPAERDTDSRNRDFGVVADRRLVMPLNQKAQMRVSLS